MSEDQCYVDIEELSHSLVDYINNLYRYAFTLTHDTTEASDLVQETYVRALSVLKRLENHDNLKGWLLTILRNIWFSELRKRRRWADDLTPPESGWTDEHIVESAANSDDIYLRKTEDRRVRRAIQQLPSRLREVILLREFEDMSYKEIAAILDCPIGTVMSRLARARRKLASYLSDVPANKALRR